MKLINTDEKAAIVDFAIDMVREAVFDAFADYGVDAGHPNVRQATTINLNKAVERTVEDMISLNGWQKEVVR